MQPAKEQRTQKHMQGIVFQRSSGSAAIGLWPPLCQAGQASARQGGAWLQHGTRVRGILVCASLFADTLKLGSAQGTNEASSLRKELAQLYAHVKFGDAIDVARKLLAGERRLGQEHPDTLIDINNLAELYRIQGRYSETEPLYRRALEAFERRLGKERPNTVSVVSNLAGLYEDEGRYKDAEALFLRTLKVRERVLGPDLAEML
jgi:tetratricopeptide (TPR) repeat protein